ncbi:uncharacterized protein LOC124944521 [Impatiens glandulifera]|uniref:uncharacterized protein LOC124944521 n=1 Tax=Impatiens glandulifera TaxID=253017 RepID=UPI001FB17E2D|nr:uncharacterized protein LOC124944521 [Impatiens glandulifera]XP_047340745.1 uncharacterized protein LOC124944521 [Impatiens glandulifera]XP_047340746.1 uncharacterized protein LOC124944521 [Impatiens glandulifera]XP_047340748.1 uncharacterized protein LOC124944521 [Impatiens glandulifera]
MATQVIVFYDGEWKITDGVSSFVPNSSRGLTIPPNTKYVELVDIIYRAINVDKSRYDLVLKVKYNLPGIEISPPVVIKEDMDVVFYLNEISTSLQHRTPLCVSLVEKPSLTNPTQESIPRVTSECDDQTQESIPRVTPEFDDPDVIPMPELFCSHENVSIDDTISATLFCEIGLEVGTLFENKKELQLRLHKYSMTNNFNFKVEKSTKVVWYVKCLDEKCKWRLRAVKNKFSEMFEVRRFVKEHTCSVVTNQLDKRQTPAWVIGECMKSKYIHHHDHLPKKIIEDMQTSYGIKMTYNKAWRSREKALMAVRGTVEDSYSKLPSYLYMLELNNPGTITDIHTDELGHFKYMFMSLGVSIRGFKSCCRPVLCIDSSFLKHTVEGKLLVAIALDANEQLYPVAFGVVDSENNNSWLYFMQKLREAIGSVPDLVFVSDIHSSIINALSVIFPEADHGACTYHIKMNIMDKFKTDHCHTEFDLASRAYTDSKFNRHFDRIRANDPRIAVYLEEIGLERWSRAFFSGKRYNQLTSNYAENFNSQSRNGLQYSITILIDYLRFTIQEWFNNRREKSSNHTERLSQYFEKILREQVDNAKFYNVQLINHFEFYVHDSESNFKVDFKSKTCSCRVFDVSGFPCTHALAAALNQNLDVYDFCSRYYSTESWFNAYAETCYPVCNEDAWNIPENIKQRVCLKPLGKVKERGRIRKRRSSQSDPRIVRRCNICGGQGHNRATCSHRS